MAFNRRPGRDRPDRPDRRGGDWRPRDRERPYDRPFAPRRPDRRPDDAGMSIRLDPRRLSSLKQLAGDAGLRPGELVLRWVEERLDAERRGGPAGAPRPDTPAQDVLRVALEQLTARVAALEASRPTPTQPAIAAAPADVAPRRRGRPPKAGTVRRAGRDGKGPRIGLHDEITAVLSERGPLTAGELAAAIVERGRYAPPRSGKPLDAATVNSRVSNPVYRQLFRRSDGRIGLADAG